MNIRKQNEVLREALSFLVKTKDHKNAHGKDDIYLAMKKIAWPKAEEALQNCVDYVGVISEDKALFKRYVEEKGVRNCKYVQIHKELDLSSLELDNVVLGYDYQAASFETYKKAVERVKA